MSLQTPLLAKAPAEPGGIRNIRIKSRLSVYFAGLLLLTIGLIYYQQDSFGGMKIRDGFDRTGFDPYNSGVSGKSPQQAANGFIKQKQHPACPIPQLEPFHESVQVHVDNLYIPRWFNCKEDYPLLFSSTLQSTIIPAQGPDYHRVVQRAREGYESCCYRTVVREGSAGGHKYMGSPQCFPVNITAETKVQDGHEFVAIFCKKKGQNETETLVDVHSFVPLKPREEGSSNEKKTKKMEDKFNVVIFGMDGISRMNFLRMMPESYSFLKNELEAVEMFGYNKIGENTIPNIMPMLSTAGGDFIWTEYSNQGYHTMLSDDHDGSDDSFLSSTGFSLDGQPIDYYLRPSSHLADPNFKTSTCYGPRLTFQVLLEYMEKFVDTMSRNKKNYFGFSFCTPLGHNYLHAPRLGDPHLLKSLRWLKESGHLQNTIFILMSDHGLRLDAIRETIQGQLEERLPLLYFVLPESFKTKYKLAYKNLLYNADKLMTTYDLHASLKDILNLDMIGGRKLLDREDDLSRLGQNLTRGISLFLPIPEFRTCEMAGIIMNFCSCTYMEVANASDPEIDAVAKAKIAVSDINSILGVNTVNITNTTTSHCAILELHKVSMVRRVGYSTAAFWSGYTINLETKPGGGQFEALVAKEEDGADWKVQGPIVRTNLYGSQSLCVWNIIRLRPYCYCLN